jgi:hypothetical protein
MTRQKSNGFSNAGIVEKSKKSMIDDEFLGNGD